LLLQAKPGSTPLQIYAALENTTIDMAASGFDYDSRFGLIQADAALAIAPISLSISINDVAVSEGNTGTTNAVFTVSLSSPSSHIIAVNFSTADSTAVAGSDYVTNSGTLIFNPGEITKTITVLINGDSLTEGDETFFVNLSNPMNATIADGQGQITIIDNDFALPAISINDATVSEGNTGTTNAVFTVSLSSPSSQTVTASYSTTDGNAIAGRDYVAAAGVLRSTL
jgi:Calx-beta domain